MGRPAPLSETGVTGDDHFPQVAVFPGDGFKVATVHVAVADAFSPLPHAAVPFPQWQPLPSSFSQHQSKSMHVVCSLFSTPAAMFVPHAHDSPLFTWQT